MRTKIAIFLGVVVILGVIALNVFVYSSTPVQPIHLPGVTLFRPLACDSPDNEAYLVSEEQVLADFGAVYNDVVDNSSTNLWEINHAALKEDLTKINTMIENVKALPVPKLLEDYHNKAVIYLQSVADLVSNFIADDIPGAKVTFEQSKLNRQDTIDAINHFTEICRK